MLVDIYISCAIVSTSLIADTFSSTFTTVLLSNTCFALSFSVIHPLVTVSLKPVVGEDDLSKAFGFQAAVTGIFRVFSGFLVGKCLPLKK